MTVPSGINVPGSYIDINNSRATDPFGTDNFVTVILGEHPIVDGGDTSIKYTRILSEADAYAQYGVSVSYELCRAFFRTLEIGTPVELYCVSKPVEKVVGGNTASITITGSIPTGMKSGTLRLILSGEEAFVNILSTMTADEVMVAIKAGADSVQTIFFDNTLTGPAWTVKYEGCSSTLFPISGSDAQDKVIIEGYKDGPLFADPSPADPAISITAEPTGDNVDAIDLNDYIAVFPDSVIDLFVNPYTEDTPTQYNLLKTEIDRRFGATVQLEGHQVICRADTVALTITDLDDEYNDSHATYFDGGNGRPTPDYLQAAALAGIMSSSLSEDPAVPMQDLVMAGMLAEPIENQRTFAELNALVGAGAAINVVDANGDLRTKRITTTYTTTDGLSDTSYRDANTIFTTSYLRQSILRLIAVKYKNFKLADDGIRANPGQKIVTPQRMTATLLGWFVEMEGRAIVENYDQFKTQLIVERNTSDRTRLDAIIPPDVVNQFRIFAGELQFIL